jgi:RimJ/RimL family protein N-acetyltransferase
VRIERFDPVTDTGKIRICHELHVAAEAVDDPEVPAASLPRFTGWVSRGWDANPREGWLVPGDQPGTWAASCLLEFPERENKHMAHIGLTVAPAHRRRGIGTALLRHAVIRAAGRGRTQLVCDTKEGSAGEAFAVAAGARRGVTEVVRILDLADVPAGLIGTLRGQAEAASAGYSIVTWPGRCPDEYLAGVAEVLNAMADAPHNPGEEPEHHDAQRLRDGEVLDEIQQTRAYSVAAVCDATGELAGMTRVVIDPLRPDWAFQQLTAVRREHRGHRLGLRVKVAMMDWLAKDEPQLQHIITGNASTNSHMVGVNVELGYRVHGRWPSWQLDVTKALEAAALVTPVQTEAEGRQTGRP